MQKIHIACTTLFIHIATLVAVNYLNIPIQTGITSVDELYSLITQRSIGTAAIVGLLIFYTSKGASIAWWGSTIYSIIYLTIGCAGFAFSILMLSEGTDALGTSALLLLQLILIITTLYFIFNKASRSYCSKKIKEAISNNTNLQSSL